MREDRPSGLMIILVAAICIFAYLNYRYSQEEIGLEEYKELYIIDAGHNVLLMDKFIEASKDDKITKEEFSKIRAEFYSSISDADAETMKFCVKEDIERAKRRKVSPIRVQEEPKETK